MFRNENVLKVKHYAYGGTGNGESANSAASAVDSDIMAIEAGTVIIGCDVIIKTAVTGSIDIGDDDDPDGFAATGAITEATPGIYVGAGDYCSAITVRKYYASAGKEVKLDATTISAGSFAVVVYGYKI